VHVHTPLQHPPARDPKLTRAHQTSPPHQVATQYSRGDTHTHTSGRECQRHWAGKENAAVSAACSAVVSAIAESVHLEIGRQRVLPQGNLSHSARMGPLVPNLRALGPW
jgi:hypothetical protein